MMLFSCATESMDDESMLMRKLACLSHGRFGKKNKAALRMEKECDFPDGPPPAAPPVLKGRRPSVRSNQSGLSSGGEMAKAKQEFVASVIDEVSVAKGEIFRLLYVDGEWAYISTCGARQEQCGFIPASYCQHVSDEEIQRNRKRVVKFEDETREQKKQQQKKPKPPPRTVGPAAIRDSKPVDSVATTGSPHTYHTLQSPGQSQAQFGTSYLLSQSMLAIPQKFVQTGGAVVGQTRPYAMTEMPQHFPQSRAAMYENCESNNASMPNLSSIVPDNKPRKLARPTQVTAAFDCDNYIVPTVPAPPAPSQPHVAAAGASVREIRKPLAPRLDDLMSIDSQSLASLTGSNHSDGGTSLVVNLPGAYPSSTSIPAYKAKVLFNFNSDGQATGEHAQAKAGDVVDVIGQDGDDWLWVQTLGGKQGLMPSCFLKAISSIEAENVQHADVQESHSSPNPPTAAAAASAAAGLVKARKMTVGTSEPTMYENELISRLNNASRPRSMLSSVSEVNKHEEKSSSTGGAGQIHRSQSTRKSTISGANLPKPEDSELGRWLEKHSFTSVSSNGDAPRPDLCTQNSVAFSIIASIRSSSGEYTNLKPEQSVSPQIQAAAASATAAAAGTLPRQQHHHSSTTSSRSSYGEQDGMPANASCSPGAKQQVGPPTVTDLAAKLGNLVVVAPQPQQPQHAHQPRAAAPPKHPKPPAPVQPSSNRPPIAPKPQPGHSSSAEPVQNAAPKEKLYNMSSYSSLPENFRCHSAASMQSYPDASVYSSAEDITAEVYDYEDVEDDEIISRLEVICDFTATGLNQISVLDGMIVIANVTKSTRGWLWVCIEDTGDQGFIPLSYTEPYETWAG
eukprot:scpid57368/ scgid4690/ 